MMANIESIYFKTNDGTTREFSLTSTQKSPKRAPPKRVQSRAAERRNVNLQSSGSWKKFNDIVRRFVYLTHKHNPSSGFKLYNVEGRRYTNEVNSLIADVSRFSLYLNKDDAVFSNGKTFDQAVKERKFILWAVNQYWEQIPNKKDTKKINDTPLIVKRFLMYYLKHSHPEDLKRIIRAIATRT